MTGLVISTSNNISRVAVEGGILVCAIKGKRIRTDESAYNGLAAGDEVDVVPTDPGKGLVVARLPRRNSYGRYNEKGRSEQAIAANVDLVCCVTSPESPPFRPRFIDRVSALAVAARVPFLIALNKADLGIPEGVESRLASYRQLGFEVFSVSTRTGQGLDEFKLRLLEKTCVLAGQSGVGKSSLISALMPGIERRIQEVSEKYDRGKHTTTQAELIVRDNLRLIDTPGIRRLALRSLDPMTLAGLFPEMASLVQDCALGARCSHSDEEGCAVRSAVEGGSVHPDRYESYLRIRQELVVPPEWLRSGVRDPGRADRSTYSRKAAGTKRQRIDRLAERWEEE